MDREETKQKVIQYYRVQREIIAKQKQINKMSYNADGVKGISYGDVKGGGIDRDHKMVAFIEAKEELDSKIDTLLMESALMWSELHMSRLTAEEGRILELAHLHRMPYEKIAENVGYAGKSGVFRRLKKIYDKLGKE